MAERVRGERHRLSEVPAGGRDHAGLRHLGREDLVEGAPWLERARVLDELELQRDAAGEIERARPELEHRRTADEGADAFTGGLDVRATRDRSIHPSM